MEIIPFPGKIFIKPEKTDLGAFEQVDSRVSESGVITHMAQGMSGQKAIANALGLEVLHVGDKVMFKAWGMDSCEINGEKYFVADLDRHNLLCIVKDEQSSNPN